jgi:hypothetical protein
VSSGTGTPPPQTERSGDRTGHKSADGNQGKGLVAILGSFFTTLPGLLTGIAALGTAFFGGTQLSSQPTPTVTVTATVTATVPARSAVSGSTANADNELVYEVAGDTEFDATFGVPDNASNGTGNSATITFYKDGGSTRMGNSFTVALDAPTSIHLNLQGTSQLEIYCSAANADGSNGDDIDMAVVNGTLSK